MNERAVSQSAEHRFNRSLSGALAGWSHRTPASAALGAASRVRWRAAPRPRRWSGLGCSARLAFTTRLSRGETGVLLPIPPDRHTRRAGRHLGKRLPRGGDLLRPAQKRRGGVRSGKRRIRSGARTAEAADDILVPLRPPARRERDFLLPRHPAASVNSPPACARSPDVPGWRSPPGSSPAVAGRARHHAISAR